MPEQFIAHVAGRSQADTVGDVDGDAMCLDINCRLRSDPAYSLISSPNGCNEHGGGGGGGWAGGHVLNPSPAGSPPSAVSR